MSAYKLSDFHNDNLSPNFNGVKSNITPSTWDPDVDATHPN